MKTQHTPTPWKVVKRASEMSSMWIAGNIKESGFATEVCYIAEHGLKPSEMDKANAAHIVKCVNLHDELVERLEYMTKLLSENKGGYSLAIENTKSLLKRAKDEV